MIWSAFIPTSLTASLQPFCQFHIFLAEAAKFVKRKGPSLLFRAFRLSAACGLSLLFGVPRLTNNGSFWSLCWSIGLQIIRSAIQQAQLAIFVFALFSFICHFCLFEFHQVGFFFCMRLHFSWHSLSPLMLYRHCTWQIAFVQKLLSLLWSFDVNCSRYRLHLYKQYTSYFCLFSHDRRLLSSLSYGLLVS